MSSIPAFSPPSFDQRASDLLAGYAPGLFTEKLHRSIEVMHRYALELSVDVLERLGVSGHLRRWHTVDELCRLSSLDPTFGRALRWLLDEGAELGWLESNGPAPTSRESRRYRLIDPMWSPDLPKLRAIGLEIDAGNAATFDLLDHAASIYPAVARGELTAEQALLGPDHIELWLAYFDNANPTYSVNNWTAASSALWRFADRPRLRVLEVGAGAGSGSDILLRLLEEHGLADRVERYVVSEPGAFFLRRARRELRRRHEGLPLEFQSLNINASWASQGISPCGFDLVYGINVMHVAHDLTYSLSEARGALAEDGWLVLGECLQSPRRKPIYPELIFQLLQTYNDVQTDAEMRPSAGFLSPREWMRALAHSGFDMQTVEPDVERITEICPNFLAGAVCGHKTARQ